MLRVSALISSLAACGIAVVAAGCTQNRAAAVHPPPGYFDAHAAPAYVGAAPSSSGPAVATRTASTGPCAPPPCAPPPCAPPPCAPPPCPPPPCPPPCGLPCENGVSNWHVRALAGFPFMFGTDAGEGCNYFGADIGTTRCNCVGIDAFYRVEFCDNHRTNFDPTNSPTARVDSRVVAAHFDRNLYGEDGGMIQFIGLKATYQHSIGSGNMYWWVGAGPEYFWTTDYIDDDDGIGFFGEVGLGWKFSQNWAARLGVDFHGDYTSVTRKAITDSGEDRMMWTVAPHIGIEFSF